MATISLKTHTSTNRKEEGSQEVGDKGPMPQNLKQIWPPDVLFDQIHMKDFSLAGQYDGWTA